MSNLQFDFTSNVENRTHIFSIMIILLQVSHYSLKSKSKAVITMNKMLFLMKLCILVFLQIVAKTECQNDFYCHVNPILMSFLQIMNVIPNSKAHNFIKLLHDRIIMNDCFGLGMI